MKASLQIFWLKRDLPVEDHHPLSGAAHHGRVLGLYVCDPELHGSPDFPSAHLIFLQETLRSLQNSLPRMGGYLTSRRGKFASVLHALRRETSFLALRSHEKTGSDLTDRRDRDQRDPGDEFRQPPQS